MNLVGFYVMNLVGFYVLLRPLLRPLESIDFPMDFQKFQWIFKNSNGFLVVETVGCEQGTRDILTRKGSGYKHTCAYTSVSAASCVNGC